MTTRAFFSALGLAAALLAGCGGCPFTKVSDITVTPASACLAVGADGTGADSPGGCVDPVLTGHNGCTDILTFAASTAESTVAQTVEPGADFTFEVRGDANGGGTSHYTVDATLGATPVTITFKVSGGYL